MVTTPAPPPEHRLRGIAARCLAASAFAVMNTGLKIASSRGVSVPELAFYRSAGAFPLVAAWVACGPGWRAVITRRPLAHVTRTAVGITSLLLTFGALSLLPIAEATTLAYSAPVVAVVLSWALLGETVGPRRWGAVLVGFAGMVLVMRPGGTDHALPTLGLAIGVGAALAQSCVMITLRTIGRTETTAAIVFWFSLLGAAAMLPVLPFFAHPRSPATLALLIGAGAIGGVGQLALTASLRLAPVAVVVPFDYIQMLWAALIGWQVFAQPPAPTMLAGAGLIAASGIYTAYRERRRGSRPAEADAMPEG